MFVTELGTVLLAQHDKPLAVILSAAKDLSCAARRCFTSFSMTGPALVVKVHNRGPTHWLSLYLGFSEQFPTASGFLISP